MSLHTPQSADSRTRVFGAAAVVGAAFVVSRVLGFAREVVFNYYYPIDGTAATAFATVSWIPELIFNVIAGGALGSAFIPTFAAYFARQATEAAWRLFAAILNLVVFAATVVSALAALAAPWLIDTLYPAVVASDPVLRETMIALLRVMLVTPVLFGAGGVLTAALHARQHFLWPSVAPIVYNVGLIGGIVLFQPDVLGIGYGAVAGAAGYLLVQLPSLRGAGARYRPIVWTRDGGVGRVLVLMLPRVLGLSFSYLNLAVLPLVAQTMEDGSVRALQLAHRLMLLPSAIFGQALGIAAFPTFSELAAESRLPEMRRILADTLRLIVFLGLPISALMMVLAEPIVALAFERGEFSVQATAYTAWALRFFAPALVALALIEVLARAFYAMQDTVTPVLLGAAQLMLMVVLSWGFGRNLFPAAGWLTFGGVALGFTLSNWSELGLLLLLLRRKMHGLDGRRLWSGVWRAGIATLLLTTVAVATTVLLDPIVGDTFLGRFAMLLAACSAGGLVYLLACQLLDLAEMRALTALVQRRLRRG